MAFAFRKDTLLQKWENNWHSSREKLELVAREWGDMLSASLQYKIMETLEVLGLQTPEPWHPKNWLSEMNKIAKSGMMARLKLSRIVVRLSSAAIHKNALAFEHALGDLIELGKSGK
jgi:hypothetical protein